MNTIQNKNQISYKPSFMALNFKKINNMNIFEEFPAKLIAKDNGVDCFVKVKAENKHYYVDIRNKENKKLAESTLNTLKEHVLYNALMNRLQYNLKGLPQVKGLGTILHLGNIITMLENKNIDKIELYSLGNTVLFHSKFKFIPNISKQQDFLNCMPEIIAKENDEHFAEIAKAAKEWGLKKQNRSKGNKIIKAYIQLLNKFEPNSSGLKYGMDMVLTKERALNNRDFFNKLFKKYNIDYKISDSDAY